MDKIVNLIVNKVKDTYSTYKKNTLNLMYNSVHTYL